MDIQIEDNEQSEENSFNVDDYINEAAFESERCGICMDIVVDRGVLDCCHHWYCFACIDNWATITNLCPLCNKEFQLITCMPVYDTLGNFDINEHAITREDNWCIQEKNNTLSFPSYYINEDAVKCLDGDGCKMRCQNFAVEQDQYMDTSIACDSCDTWYHAFCVEFDPQSQPQSSWFCPRCVNDQVPQEYNLKIADHGSSIDSSFSGRVSVSVADAGETAVVVSMVDIHQSTKAVTDSHPVDNVDRQEPFHNNCDSTRPVIPLSQGCDPQNLLDSTVFTPEGKLVVSTSTQDTQLEVDVLTNNTYEKPLGVSMLEDTLFLPQEATPMPTNLQSATEGQDALKPCTSYECNTSVLNATSTSSNMTNHENPHGLCLELSHSSKSDVDVAETVNIEVRNVSQDTMSFSSGVADTRGAGLRLADEHRELPKRSRKSRSPVRGDNVDVDAQIEEKEGGPCTSSGKVYLKKARLGESSEQAQQVNVPNANDSQGCLYSKNSPIESHLLSTFVEKSESDDIMSIVQEVQYKSSSGPDKIACAPKGGLRVKKIMRRVGDDAESTVLVQKLKNEIRDAVQKNPSNNLIDNFDAFDRKLLAAFRAAIVKPKNEMDNKIDRSPVPVKNVGALRRGKTRESLIKKIYGAANGRRRPASARDRQIEFWRHRCLRKKPEKVEALKSVLEVLKTLHSSPDKVGSKKESEVTSDKSILSRVYLADTSVFPRKENVKPLSSLAEVSVGTDIDKNREHKCNDSNAKNLVVVPKEKLSVSERVAVCSNVRSKKEVSCSSQQSDSMPGHTLSKTADKRKWAMEILARKSASGNTEKHIGKEEDNSMLKSTHPLLAQLPVDMRPVLIVSRHNKVPFSTRQAQLHRLTEFYLQKADMPVVCRSAAAELAVADAINIEKAILDKSISKSVYVNLCSQHIVACKHQKVEKLGPLHENNTTENSEQGDKVDSEPVETFSSEEEVLKLTGLLSDSPPESPAHPAKCAEDEDSEKLLTQKGCFGNFLETCSNSGNFDYNLGEVCTISSSLSKAHNVSNSGSDDSDLKPKVAFSTLNYEKLDDIVEYTKEHAIMPIDVNEERPISLNESTDIEMQTEPVSIYGKDETQLHSNTDNSEHDSLDKQNSGEISFKECEDSYGPERKSLAESIPGKKPETATKTVVHENDNMNSQVTIYSETNAFIANKPKGGFSAEDKIAVSQSCEKEIMNSNKLLSDANNVFQKVEAYIKEHIRPLCKSRVITVEQYRWAVGKTAEKVMKYHCKAKNANFLIKEGDKVKKLAEQYVEAAQRKEWKEASN